MPIDSHQHFWRFDPARDAWITSAMSVIRRDFLPRDLAPVLSAAGVDGCIAVQADQSEQETEFLLGLAREHAFIAGVVGWVDVRSTSLDRMLDGLVGESGHHLKGVRHIAQAEADDFLQRPDVVSGIGRLARHGLTYDILVYERQLPAAIALASALPEQRFVLDHLGKPRIKERVLEPWASRIRDLARRPNVWCKVSGLVTEADWRTWRADDLAPYLDVVFEAFGPRRLMWGSDWPVCLLAAPYARVHEIVVEYASKLSSQERDWIFGGTARDFYGSAAQ